MEDSIVITIDAPLLTVPALMTAITRLDGAGLEANAAGSRAFMYRQQRMQDSTFLATHLDAAIQQATTATKFLDAGIGLSDLVRREVLTPLGTARAQVDVVTSDEGAQDARDASFLSSLVDAQRGAQSIVDSLRVLL